MTEPIEISQDILDKLLRPSTATLTTVLNKKGFWNTFMRGVTPLNPEMNVHGPLTGGCTPMVGSAFTFKKNQGRGEHCGHVSAA